MPAPAISSISTSGTEPWPFHIPGCASTQTPPGPLDQLHGADRVERMLRDVRDAVVADVAVEGLLLGGHDPGLDHRLRHVRPRDQAAARDLLHALERDVVAELLELLDHHLAAPEPRVDQALQLGLELLVRGVDPVREDVEARALVLGRELDARARSRGRCPSAAANASSKPSRRVVVGDRDARRGRGRARASTFSVIEFVPSEQVLCVWRSYPLMRPRVADRRSRRHPPNGESRMVRPLTMPA